MTSQRGDDYPPRQGRHAEGGGPHGAVAEPPLQEQRHGIAQAGDGGEEDHPEDEPGRETPGGLDLDEYMNGIREYFRLLPADRFPMIVSMVDTFTGDDSDERFEFGLDLIIKGLAGHSHTGARSSVPARDK